MSIGDAMKIIELRGEIEQYRRQVTMHHNAMIDIAIMIEEGDYDEALAKAQSFFVDEPPAEQAEQNVNDM